MARYRSIASTLLVLAAAMPQTSGAADPPAVYVVDTREQTTAERLLCASIQGIANREAQGPLVFLLTNETDQEWLSYSLRVTSAETNQVTPDQLLEAFRSKIRGQVLYDPSAPYTVEVATTVAGLRDLVITPRDLGLPTIFDFRGRWSSASAAYGWAIASLLPECNQSKAALLPADALDMRDFAIQQRMFVLSPPATADDASFQRLLFQLPPGTALYGEASPTTAAELSRCSHFLVSAAQTANLSFLSMIEPGLDYHQYIGYLEARAPRYLTLIFDCSDLDFAVNEMPGLWDSPIRGSLTLGWALPGVLAEAAPPIARRYYRDAYWSGTDQFVLGRSGAGQMDLSQAPSPYAFFDATAQARARLDAPAALCTVSDPIAGVSDVLVRFAHRAGLRALFLVPQEDFEPALQEGVALICAPRCESAEAAVTYLNRIPLERRIAALVLDPSHMTPEDAAHIAAHVASRYVTVPPAELVEIMHTISAPARPGQCEARVASVDYGDPVLPGAPIRIIAQIEPPDSVSSAAVLYKPAEHALSFFEPLSLSASGGYTALVPPLPQGGDVILRVRAQDRAGRETWSPTWTITLPRVDADADGLADAEEDYLLTDPNLPDTDGDGLTDSADPTPLRFDRSEIRYAGPIRPPSDLPYLVDVGDSQADFQGRHLLPGQSCTYFVPLPLVPEAAPAAIDLEAAGTLRLACGADLSAPSQGFEGEVDGLWYSEPLPPESDRSGVFLRLACPETAGSSALIYSISVVSTPGSPSIAEVATYPAYPGPGQPVSVSAAAFSPQGMGEVRLTYRVNDSGTIAVPMATIQNTSRYEARIPALANRDVLEFWISASTAEGETSVTAPVQVTVGSWGREVVSLLARRDFLGDWSADACWGGAARVAPRPDLRDTAYVHLRGGTYTVWILAGGRGQSIDVTIQGKHVGSVDPALPDGWQRLGRVRLEDGRHEVRLVSQWETEAPSGATPRYAAVILSADSTLVPPANRVLDVHDSISVLFPPVGHTLSGWVELRATGAGNITGAEFSLDGTVLGRASGPPFRLSLNTGQLAPGPHTLTVTALDRVGPTGLAIDVPVTVAE